MEPSHDHSASSEPPQIQQRTDTGGPWSAAWPLIALALIGLMVVRACLPSAPVAASAPPTMQAPR